MRRRISIRGCVRPSVRPSVRRSVGPALFSEVKSTHTRRNGNASVGSRRPDAPPNQCIFVPYSLPNARDECRSQFQAAHSPYWVVVAVALVFSWFLLIFTFKSVIFMTGTGSNHLYPRKKSRGIQKIGFQKATEPATCRKMQKLQKFGILHDFGRFWLTDGQNDGRTDTRNDQI